VATNGVQSSEWKRYVKKGPCRSSKSIGKRLRAPVPAQKKVGKSAALKRVWETTAKVKDVKTGCRTRPMAWEAGWGLDGLTGRSQTVRKALTARKQNAGGKKRRASKTVPYFLMSRKFRSD